MAEIADTTRNDRGHEDQALPVKAQLKHELENVLADINERFHETGERQIIKQSLYSALEMWDRLEEIE